MRNLLKIGQNRYPSVCVVTQKCNRRLDGGVQIRRPQVQAMRPNTAAYVRSLLPQIDEHIVGLTGQATPQETGRPTWLSWFVGLAPAEASPFGSTASMLPFDPAQAGPAPTATPQVEREQARYVVVAVVVTDEPNDDLAIGVTKSSSRIILGR